MQKDKETIAELQFVLAEAGLKEAEIARLTRFIMHDFDSPQGRKEKARWIEVGLYKDDQIVITDADLEALSTVNFCLWDLVYRGDLKFLPPDQFYVPEEKKAGLAQRIFGLVGLK